MPCVRRGAARSSPAAPAKARRPAGRTHRASCRRERNVPRSALVIVFEFCFSTPRIIMHEVLGLDDDARRRRARSTPRSRPRSARSAAPAPAAGARIPRRPAAAWTDPTMRPRGDVRDVRAAEEGKHVVLAQRVQLNVAHHDHALVRFVEQRIADHLRRVEPVPAGEPGQRLGDPRRRLGQPSPIRVFSQKLELAADDALELRDACGTAARASSRRASRRVVAGADFSRRPASRTLRRPESRPCAPSASPRCARSCSASPVPPNRKPRRGGAFQIGVRRGVFEAQSNV